MQFRSLLTLSILVCLFSFSLAFAHDDKGSVSAVLEHQESAAKAAKKLSEQASLDLVIGVEAGDLAEQQLKSSLRIAETAVDIEKNPKKGIRAFLFGSDYKNLGALRSEIVITENRIGRLERLRETTKDPIARAAIDVQIKEAESANDATLAFMEAHQGGFSLFGWLVRIFSR